MATRPRARRVWPAQGAVAGETTRSSGLPGIKSPIPIASVGIVRATPIQNRRVISRSSSFSGSSAVIVNGSSAIPQIGHEPGPSRMISGCIGQVHLVDPVGIWDTGFGIRLVRGGVGC